MMFETTSTGETATDETNQAAEQSAEATTNETATGIDTNPVIEGVEPESETASVESGSAPVPAEPTTQEFDQEPVIEGVEPEAAPGTVTAESGQAALGESASEASNSADEAPAAAEAGETPAEPPAPKVLDLETIAIRTTTIEKDLETAEHRSSLTNRLLALQDALGLLERSEDRAMLDARLAAVQSSIAEQAAERIAAKEEIVARAESLVESQDWKATSEALREMQEALRAIGAAGKELDDPVWERFRAARSGFHERRQAHFAERQKQWEESKTKKEALAAEAEGLAEETDFKAKSPRARSMMDDWKAAGFAGREAEDVLWPRFRGALDVFYERRTAWYEQNRVEKERLAGQAEEVSESTDWRTGGEAMKRLMDEWKTIGSAGREHDDALWQRFRGAQQKFHESRSANFAERETQHKENVVRKEELCEQAEAIALRDDMRGAIQEIIDLQAAWKTVGFIPREQSDALWRRFKAACDAVFSHVDLDREARQQSREQGHKDAATRKREQYQRLNESIAHDQANINRWRDTISSLGSGGRADQIRGELEDRVIEVLMRVRDKQARAEELANDLQQMESQS
jgi:hypothetical protein